MPSSEEDIHAVTAVGEGRRSRSTSTARTSSAAARASTGASTTGRCYHGTLPAATSANQTSTNIREHRGRGPPSRRGWRTRFVPGVRIEDDATLRTALAPVARAVHAHRPESELEEWSREDREALLGGLLADAGTPAAIALQRVLQVAARTFYSDPATWPALGYRRCGPARAGRPARVAPAAITVDALGGRLRRGRDRRGRGRRRRRVRARGGGPPGPARRARRGAAARRPAPRPPAQRARVDGLERQADPPVAGNPRFVGDDAVLPTEPAWNNNAMTVGGGTRVYGAQAWRFCPEDFRMGSTYGEPFVGLADRLRGP